MADKKFAEIIPGVFIPYGKGAPGTPKPKGRVVRFPVRCNECQARFTVRTDEADPQCPECNSVDVDVT